MIPVPRWREFYNPLAGLTVARLNAIHAAADRGQHAAAQWLYRFAEQADVTIQAAIARRLAFLDTLGWQVRHESLDMAKRTEAAGWILALEHRPGDSRAEAPNGAKAGAGLWGRIRWTDAGEAAVRGGRYRFLSPVWKQEDCEPLG